MKRKIFLILFIALTVAILQADLASAGFVMSDIDQMGLAPFDFQVNSSDLLAEDQAISFQFHLNYDADLFVYNGYTTGADLPGMLVVNDLNPGLINVVWASAAALTGINELMSINLEPVEPCETAITLTEARYNNTDITNFTGGMISIVPFPVLGLTIEDVEHQGLSAFDVTVQSIDILLDDGILSYQFSYYYDPEIVEYVDSALDPDLNGQLVVNAEESGMLNVAYAGADPISGINDLLIITFQAVGYGYDEQYISDVYMNNYEVSDDISGLITVYPAWEEITVSVTGADVFIGDQFMSAVQTSLVMPENGLVAFQFILTYDAELLEYAGLNEQNRFIDDLVINDTVPGVLQVAYANSDVVYGEGSLVEFLFNAIDDGTTELTLSEVVYNNEYITNLVQGEVIITNPNNAPIASAGVDFEILEGEAGMLDGSGSYDPNDDDITYLWTGDLVLDDETAINPTFTAPEVEENTYIFMTLTVDDGEFIATDEVLVTIINVPNPADAVISMDDQDVTLDQEFPINVYTTPLDADFGVISYQYIVNYDPAILTYTGSSIGTGMPDGMLVVNDTEPGVLQVAFSTADAITNPDYLTQFTFVGTVLDQSEINISDFYYNNTAVQNVLPAMITVHVPYYYTGVYIENEEVGLNMEFTSDLMTEELMADWEIISYQFDLYYDPAMLEFSGYQLGDVPTGGNLLAYEITPGHVSVAFADFNALIGAGSIAGFNFIPQQLGSTDIIIENFKYNAAYLPNVEGGTINIIIPYSNAVISAPELTVGGGETFTVGISTTDINPAWGVISFQFDLGFDADLLDFVGYNYGSIINAGNLLAYENADGNVAVAFANFDPIGGEGTLIELEFTAAMELDQSVLDIGNFKYNSLFLDDANIYDGMVTIVEPYADAVITCQDAETREGLNFTVGISTTELQENWGLISFQFNLGFDPEYVEYVGYEAGNVITSGNLLAFENAAGNITVAFADYMSLSGVGDLIVLEFTALLAGDTTLDLNEFKYNAFYLDNLVDGSVFIDVGNYPPVAVAGPDQIVDEGEVVMLNGTASYDPDDYLRVPQWDLNPPDYEYNGFIWGMVTINGIPAEDLNDMIGVFVGDECRGIAQQSDDSVQDYTVPFGYYAFMPQVYSNVTDGEVMTFKFYDASADMIYDVEGELPFTADMVVGGGMDPYVFVVTAEPTYDLTFNWLAPDGIILDDPASPTPSFTAPWLDADTDLVFGLEVSDGQAWSEIDEVVVTVIDHPIDEIVVSAPEFTLDEDVQFDVPITTTMIQPDMDVISYQFNLYYDPVVIQYDGFTAGALSPNMLVVYNVEPGMINVAYADNNPITGEGELLSFQFTTLDGGVSPLDIANFKYNNVFVNMVDGSVEVIDVNDPPVFDLPPMISFNEDEVLVEDFSQYIIDPDNDEHTIIFSGNSMINISVMGYDVTMSAPADWFGSETVTFIVTDNAGAVAFDTTVINVVSVNDPPVLDVPPVMYFDEDGEMIFDIGMYSSDVENDPLLLYVTGMVNLEVVIDGLVATITGTDNWNGEELLTFTVDDQQGRATASDDCNFVVEPVNDPPIADAGDDFEILEGEPGMLDGSGSYDPDDEITYLWTGDLVLDDETVINPTFTAPEVEENTDIVMTLTVDDGEFIATDEVLVTIINVPNPADAVIFMDDQDVILDEEFPVNVYTTPLNADFGVISYQYIVNYDPAILTYTGSSNGTGMPEGMLVVNDTEPGVLQVAFSTADAITNPDYLTQFTFVGTVLDQSEINISDFYYNNTAVQNLLPATITVHVPYYYTGVYIENEEAGLDMEFTCDLMTEELMADWEIISYQFDLYYDPAMLEFSGYQLGDVPTGGNLLAYEITPGHVSVAFADFNALVGAGSIAGFNFIPQQLGSTDITIENFKYNATYLPNVEGGTIDIIIPFSNAVISAPELTVGGGETFTVGISTSDINEGWNVISFQFDLGFDPELLDYVGYSNGSIINSGNLLAYENADGNVSVAFADFAPISGEGTLIELEFTAAMELDQSVLDIENFEYNSLYLDDANIYDGMVTIVEPYADAVITCQDAETREGLNFTVGISTTELQENWGVISFQFNVGFDPEYVEFVGYEAGNVITSGNLLAFENVAGNITVAFADYMSLSGVGDLIVMEFTALLAGDTTLDLNEFKYNALYLDNLVDGSVFIDVGNYPPVAVAGPDQIVDEGEVVMLNGTASYDPDDYLRVPQWDLNPPDYEYNGFIWGMVTINGIPAEDLNDMIGVFVGDECRGIAQQSDDSVQDYTVPFGYYAFMPQVYSNVTDGEVMTFKFYDASADMIYDVEGELPFTADMVVGGGMDPYVFVVTAEPTYDLTFNWLAPNGIILDDPASPTPSFTAPWLDADTDLVFGLEVSDGQAWSEIDEVVVTVIDHPIDEIVVSAPELTLNEDEPFDVPISTTMIQPDMNIISYQFNLYYDPAVIQYDGFTAGALSPNMLVVYNVEPGLINIAYADNTPITGEGELLSFQFTALEGGVSPLDIANFKYNNVFINVVDGSVEVIGVNDPPIFDLPPMFSFNEDEVLVEDFSQYIIDPDNNTHTIIFTGNNQIDISINGYEVTMSAPENWFGSEPVTFIVDDNSSRAVAVDATIINVIPVNDPPVLDVPPIMYFDEDGEMIFDIGMYSSDVENDELLLYVSGMVNLEVAIDGLVATITGTDNWNGEETLTFTVDDQQGRATATDNCSFVVNPMNDPPTLDLPEYWAFNEDESLLFDVSLYAEDIDYDQLSIVSVEYEEVNLYNSFSNMEIDFSSAENWNGSTDVTVTITDTADRYIASDVMTVEVLAVNDTPEIDLPVSINFDEDTVEELDFSQYLYDVDMDELLLTVAEGVNVHADIVDHMVTFTADENWNGAEDLEFTVNDQQGRAIATDILNVIVNPVNDAPYLDLPIFISFNEDEELSFDISSYATDVDLDALNIVNVDYDQENLYNSFTGLIIDFSAAENWNGLTEVTITITDNVGRDIASDVMDVIVHPVNDPPEFINLPDSLSFNEDEILEVNFSQYLYDVDMDPLNLTVSGGIHVDTAQMGDFLIFAADENWFGEEELVFTIDDQQGRATAMDTINIIVYPVNDPPEITEFLPIETEFSIADTSLVTFSISTLDIEEDSEISWYLNDLLLPGINTAEFAITFDRNGNYIVKAQVTDADYMAETIWNVLVWMGPDWVPVVYPSSTIVYSRVTIDGLPVSELDMVGAFVDGEIRGWVNPVYSVEDEATYATITVNGVEIEEIDFSLYDYSANLYYSLYETYTTDPGGEIGTPPDFINLAFGSGYGPNWTPVIYTNSTIVYGIVQIEGLPAEEGDRVGTFVGPECRAVSDVVILGDSTAIVTLIVQGETAEIAHFKIWDSSENAILSVPLTITTSPGGEIGYPPDQIIINASESANITQLINLQTGWNLLSLNIYPSSYLIADIFGELIENEELIKVKNIFYSYDPDLLPVYNTLTEIDDGAAYYVKVTNNTALSLEGLPVNVADTQIALSAGWNLTGYLPQVSQDLEDALFTIIDQLLKIKDSFGSYDPSLPPEFNTLTTMTPGSGYWIKMFSAATLIYPDGLRASQQPIAPVCPIWEPVIYTNSTIAYGHASLEGLPADGFIGAFAGDECRAVSVIDNGIISLVINGIENEEISFKLYQDEVVYSSNQMVTTDPGNDVSDIVIYFDHNDAPLVTGLANIYPNPFNPQTTISYEISQTGNVKVDIYNIRGQKIETLVNEQQSAGDYKLIWNATHQASGVYFLRFQTTGHSETRKMILMK